MLYGHRHRYLAMDEGLACWGPFLGDRRRGGGGHGVVAVVVTVTVDVGRASGFAECSGSELDRPRILGREARSQGQLFQYSAAL